MSLTNVAGAFGRIAGLALRGVCQFGAEGRVLASIRDALLPKLLSGKVRVDAAAVNVRSGEHA